LFESCVCQFQDIDDSDDCVLRVHDRKIEIVAI
jgi:hypothetical protein